MMKNKTKNESGQSTIEFILSFSLGIGFLFSFYKMAILFTNGYLVHYATFQASRSYMVGESGSRQPDGSDSVATSRANIVFNYYQLSEIVPGFDSGLQFHDPETNSGNQTNLYVGVKTRYSDFIFIPGTSKKVFVPMVSESFLGLEPTRGECFSRVCRSMEDVGAQCSFHVTVVDNGC